MPAPPTNTQKQAAEAPSGARAAAPQAPATEGAPAVASAGGSTTTNAAPQAAPVGSGPAAAPASSPRAPEAFGAGAAAPTAPASAPATAGQALSRGPADAGDASKAAESQDVRLPSVELRRTDAVSTWLLTARLALAASTVVLGLAALVLTIRRRASR